MAFFKLPLSALIITLLTAMALSVFLFFSAQDKDEAVVLRTSGAGTSMDYWVFERSYPYGSIPVSKFSAAYEQKVQHSLQKSTLLGGEWESLGPKNIGGRTLCLAFHPEDADVIYAGSASGGLWKTTTQGVGEDAWEYVPTGFPVLGVSAIAIDEGDPDVMYIGTGETYGVGFAAPGEINRLTRGTYGIGILKTSDGGDTWTQSLSFEMDEIKGVQDIVISAEDTDILFAATTDGVHKSTDAGESWSLVFSQPNCIDLEMDPTDNAVVYVTQGNFNSTLNPALSGIFKTTNGGSSWSELLDDGLLGAWSGNAKLSIDPMDNEVLYASIQVGWFNQGPTTPGGLYRSQDAGDNWTKINEQNIAMFQGWYSHDIAIHPTEPNQMMYVGIDAWKSTDSGSLFVKNSNWELAPFGEIPVDEPSGGPNYVHADIHAVYYHPLVEDKVFFATDGGVFSSEDAGDTFITNNGGLQTVQFYANMSSSTTDSSFCIAGAQDNATYLYLGTPSWTRIIGGDGMSAAIRPDNDSILYGSYQNLNILKSIDHGEFYFPASPILNPGDFAAFVGPYEIAPSENDVMYAGAMRLYRSENAGDDWTPASSQTIDGANRIVKIAISPVDTENVLVSTSPDPLNPQGATVSVMRSTDGGETFDPVNGLPDRICKDIEFDPNDEDILFAAFSGFGTNHLYLSTNGGADWIASDAGLPDVPTNTIAFDPTQSDNVYVGNDLGVYFSDDGGASWIPFCENLPEATLVMDLNVSLANDKIRIATHGHGMYQRPLVDQAVSTEELAALTSDFQVFPVPAETDLTISFSLDRDHERSSLTLYSTTGREVASIYSGRMKRGENILHWNGVAEHASGTYVLVLSSDGMTHSETIQIQ